MKKLLIAVLILLIGVFAVSAWWQSGKKATNPQSKNKIIFVIKKGGGIKDIAAGLKKQDLIRDPVIFFLYIKEKGLDKKIQAGDYRLSPAMDLESLVKELTHGTLDVWITVPEGLRAEEIAQIFKANLINYDSNWQDILIKNNGYLFPDTYLIPKDADISLIIALMKNNFYKKIAGLNLDKNDKNLPEIVIKASLLEREVKYQTERAMVASVINNRLEIGMPLQIDASIQYALGYDKDDKTWWKKNLTNEDLKINSLFNTYKLVGLPPLPISNPGLQSLAAALHPAKSDYIYYVSDKAGHLHFAKNLTEHNANINRYLNDNLGY